MRYLYNRGHTDRLSKLAAQIARGPTQTIPHMSPWLAVATMPEGLLETFSSRLQRAILNAQQPHMLLHYFYLNFQADWQLGFGAKLTAQLLLGVGYVFGSRC